MSQVMTCLFCCTALSSGRLRSASTKIVYTGAFLGKLVEPKTATNFPDLPEIIFRVTIGENKKDMLIFLATSQHAALNEKKDESQAMNK
jgi:hypothetical protein